MCVYKVKSEGNEFRFSRVWVFCYKRRFYTWLEISRAVAVKRFFLRARSECRFGHTIAPPVSVSGEAVSFASRIRYFPRNLPHRAEAVRSGSWRKALFFAQNGESWPGPGTGGARQPASGRDVSAFDDSRRAEPQVESEPGWASSIDGESDLLLFWIIGEQQQSVHCLGYFLASVR